MAENMKSNLVSIKVDHSIEEKLRALKFRLE